MVFTYGDNEFVCNWMLLILLDIYVQDIDLPLTITPLSLSLYIYISLHKYPHKLLNHAFTSFPKPHTYIPNPPKKIMLPPTSLPSLLPLITTPWTPHLLASINDHQLKVAKIDGAFIFHAHEESDELFYLLDGRLVLELEVNETALPSVTEDNGVSKGGPEGDVEASKVVSKDKDKEVVGANGKRIQSVEMSPGDVFVVPRGVRHRPVARAATILMVEREGTVNTGGEGGHRTAGVREGRRGV